MVTYERHYYTKDAFFHDSGRVTRGLEVVDAIANVPVRQGRSGERSTPTEEVRIDRVMIQEE